MIPKRNSAYFTRNQEYVPSFKTNHNFFKNSFFPATVNEWNNLDPDLRNSETYGAFKSNILKFIRPSPNSVFNCHNPQGIKLITRLRVGLSHLREHKFKHSFQDSLNPLCPCGSDVESSSHFLLDCPLYANERRALLSTIRNVDCKLLETEKYNVLTQTLLFGNVSFDEATNTRILNATIDYMLSTKRFQEALF